MVLICIAICLHLLWLSAFAFIAFSLCYRAIHPSHLTWFHVNKSPLRLLITGLAPNSISLVVLHVASAQPKFHHFRIVDLPIYSAVENSSSHRYRRISWSPALRFSLCPIVAILRWSPATAFLSFLKEWTFRLSFPTAGPVCLLDLRSFIWHLSLSCACTITYNAMSINQYKVILQH